MFDKILVHFKFSIIIWLLGTIFCFAQVDSTKIPFIAYWSKGDSYDFLITKISKHWNRDKLERQDSSSYYTTFTVIDSTESSYKINWKYKANFGDFPPQFGELLNNNNVILDFIYTTNEFGEFIEVENWEEVSGYIKKTFEVITQNLISKKADFDIDKFNKTIEPFISIFTSKEGIETIVLKELVFFHFPFGTEFDPNETVEYEDELPNLFGGKPIRGDSKIYFHMVDFEDEICSFSHEMKINSEDAKNMVNHLLTQMGFDMEKVENELLEGKLDITDNNYFEYFYNPGIPNFIETNRLVELDAGKMKNKKQDIIRIELILDED